MNLQQLIALQKASGGQNVITPDNAGRIMGLAAQQEANRQLSVDAGRLAVEERKRLQQLEAGQTPGVVTAPSGAKFVTDAQGNVVGTNAPIGVGAGGIGDRAAINRGEATAQERALIGPAIREAFQLEMQKRAPAPAPAPIAEAPAKQPPMTPAQSTAFLQATAPSPAKPPTATPVREADKSVVSAQGIPALRQAFEQQALKSEKESVGTRLSDAERKAKEAMTRFESGKGSASKEELQALAEEYAAAQAEAELLNTPPQEQEAKLAELIKQIRQGKAEKMEPKGIFPRIGFGYESGKSYVSDAFQNAIMNPLREAFTGETAKPSNELYRYLLQQQLMRQAGF